MAHFKKISSSTHLEGFPHYQNAHSTVVDTIQSEKYITPHRVALRISGLYILCGTLWIVFSDRILLTRSLDISILTRTQTYKGWFYVSLTAFFLYFLIVHYTKIYHSFTKELLHCYEELETTYEELLASQNEQEKQLNHLRESQTALLHSEERYRLAIEGANDAIWDYDVKNQAFYFSRTKKLLGYEDHDLEDTHEAWKTLLHPDDIQQLHQDLEEFIASTKAYYYSKYRLRRKDGQYRWIMSRGKATRNEDGKITRVCGSHRDITEQKQAEERIYDLSYYDTLTGLPNQALFEDKLNQALTLARERNHRLAIIHMDLDNFKVFNDTLGHKGSDQLLIHISSALKNTLHEIDSLMRLNGDSFVILLSMVQEANQVMEVAEDLMRLFDKTWSINDKEFHVTISMGIAIYPDDALNPRDLLKKSETAMYHAKDNGRNCFFLYSKEMSAKLLERVELEHHLRSALKHQEFSLHYQPLIDLLTGNIFGVEALIRWNHPSMGLISPVRFIPVAEESNLILPIGEWVLRTACQQQALWKSKGIHPLIFSINLSTRQLQQANFVEIVGGILEECQTDPEFIEFEITESAVMDNLEVAIDTLTRFKEMGIRIALDDFGTGYSSLNYLKQLPIDTIKIDKSFINDILTNPKEEAIARAIIDLSHHLNFSVTAEGVETQEQLTFLRDCLCDKAQGYFFSKPLPDKEVENLLLKKKSYL
ncbi:MAG: EAL domain-containing protein [Thermotaleaceae bacterium]